MGEETAIFEIEEFGTGSACIHCTRELTLFSFDPLEKAFGRLFDKGINRVAFEYTQEQYSPSFGGVFLAAAERARNAGGNICLVGLATAVRDALKIAGFDSAFLFADNVEEARKLLAK